MTKQNYYDPTETFKIVVIGDSNTGKTNMITRYVNNEFSHKFQPTIGVEFFQKTVALGQRKGNKKAVKLQIWDTAGQERFRGMSSSFYREANGAIIVYDITNKESFKNVERWISEVKNFATEDVQIMLVGNKSDLFMDRVIMKSEGEELGKKNRIQFFEISALENSNGMIEKVFKNLTYKIEEKERQKRITESTVSYSMDFGSRAKSFNLKEKKSKKDNGCC